MNKKIVFSLIILAFGNNLYAQIDSSSVRNYPKSKVEEFTDRQSTLIMKEFIDIGNTRNLTVQVLKVTDMSTREKYSGLVISWVNVVSGISSTTYSTFLDADEIEDLSKALMAMFTVTQSTPLTYTEYKFQCKSGLQITAFFTNSKQWRASAKNDRYRSSTYFNIDELQKLQGFLQVAKTKL